MAAFAPAPPVAPSLPARPVASSLLVRALPPRRPRRTRALGLSHGGATAPGPALLETSAGSPSSLPRPLDLDHPRLPHDYHQRQRQREGGHPIALNRILLHPSEITILSPPSATPFTSALLTSPSTSTLHLTATLPPNDPRTVHVRTILQKATGDTLKVGILRSYMTTATITWLPSRGLRIDFPPFPSDSWTPPPTPPRIHLLLAVPRPRVLTRLVPTLATLGLRALSMLGAARVEGSYFGAHALKDEEISGAIIEGLMQAGCDTYVPDVTLYPVGVSQWIREHNLDERDSTIRLVAHPPEPGETGVSVRGAFANARKRADNDGAVYVAVGPVSEQEAKRLVVRNRRTPMAKG